MASSATISFRHIANASPYFRMGIAHAASDSTRSGTFLVSILETDWITVDPAILILLGNLPAMIGKTCEISSSGQVIGTGKVDVKMNIIDSNHDTVSVFNKADIPISKWHNFQLSSETVRGKLFSLHNRKAN